MSYTLQVPTHRSLLAGCEQTLPRNSSLTLVCIVKQVPGEVGVAISAQDWGEGSHLFTTNWSLQAPLTLPLPSHPAQQALVQSQTPSWRVWLCSLGQIEEEYMRPVVTEATPRGSGKRLQDVIRAQDLLQESSGFRPIQVQLV